MGLVNEDQENQEIPTLTMSGTPKTVTQNMSTEHTVIEK